MDLSCPEVFFEVHSGPSGGGGLAKKIDFYEMHSIIILEAPGM